MPMMNRLLQALTLGILGGYIPVIFQNACIEQKKGSFFAA